MSPPKVTLASKPTPVVDESMDELKEKTVEMSNPAFVTVETERNVHVLRGQYAAMRRRRVIISIMFGVMLMVFALGTLSLVSRMGERHRNAFQCRYGKHKLPEHVRVDHANRLIYAKHDHDHQANTPALHMLHEYDRRLLAYKDVEKNICYIDRLDETFENGYERWLSYEKHGRPEGKTLARVSPTPIEVDVLKHVGDIHIYMHCMNATSFWFMEVDEKVTQNVMVVHV